MTLINKKFAQFSLAAAGLIGAPFALASEVAPAPVQVPEPETLALLAMGFIAIVIARKFRK